ncbi:MAG TPA: PRC-barrel domain-containing protein [Thermoplasmataceae archaeon]|nr:PRC-barrel domain-containing protein [Thermoplasmataceae archaeon]
MLTEITELYGKPVYNDKAILIGEVSDVIVDFEENDIYGLYIERPNPKLVENSASICIPFRWIKAIDEIILLRRFPDFVPAPKEE